ncbi:pyridoxamine 5'-phosphate oxidase family protein [Mangrovicoccus algicola]|uniref:Pyridoxamine 5'-phosphate oxidase family protein n=1 Tax=Mangrovicoccus algicola TaxID=2771008 RepID=A0A8J6YZF9_9RHOB|nr:pyridoxamine 5'-phosphate oxidase family protein [Mangrovicoccus algicola]MBE3640672.1 pyridoxamine 5'-phosphate oxidase family protein [Mangrovicoccus algicola]
MDRTDPPPGPLRAADDEARALARRLLAEARFAALAAIDHATGAPAISRIALLAGPDGGGPVSLISRLAGHAANLAADPRCALLLGEPGPKGDPLTHPRLSLSCLAEPLPREHPAHGPLRDHWLRLVPKAGLYVDFADFGFQRFRIVSAALNGGFGRAWRMTPEDLSP